MTQADPLPVHPPGVPAGGLPEVITVSTLLTMPALWTSLVRRELPVGILLERYLVILLTCILLSGLLRRLGEGGALLAPAGAPEPGGTTDRSRDGLDRSRHEPGPLSDGLDAFGVGEPFPDPFASPLDAPLDDAMAGGVEAATSPLALEAALGDLPPLDLSADPFADPLASPSASPLD